MLRNSRVTPLPAARLEKFARQAKPHRLIPKKRELAINHALVISRNRFQFDKCS